MSAFGSLMRRRLRLEAHFAAARRVDLRDHVEQRGLARAGRSDDGQKLAVGDREAQVLDHPRRWIAAGARRQSACSRSRTSSSGCGHDQRPCLQLESGRRTPAQQPALDCVDAPVAEEDDAGRGGQRGEDAGGVEIHGAELHQIAKPAVGRNQFGDDGAADRIGHGDAQAGEDVGHRAGKHDVARHVALARAHHLRHLHELGVERAHAGQRAEIDDEEHRDGDQRDLRFDADAEPQDEQRRQRELRRAIAADHERIEDRRDHRQSAQRERQRDRRDRADEKAGGGLGQRVGRMAQQIAADDAGGEPRRHAPWRTDPIDAERQAEHLPDRDAGRARRALVAARAQPRRARATARGRIPLVSQNGHQFCRSFAHRLAAARSHVSAIVAPAFLLQNFNRNDRSGGRMFKWTCTACRGMRSASRRWARPTAGSTRKSRSYVALPAPTLTFSARLHRRGRRLLSRRKA